jgi:hypothetical protein
VSVRTDPARSMVRKPHFAEKFLTLYRKSMLNECQVFFLAVAGIKSHSTALITGYLSV